MKAITAQELRIGNIVEYKIFDELADPKEYWEQNVIDAYDIVHIHKFPIKHDYRPIPLTEDWLIRLGFKKRSETYFSYQNHFDVINIIDGGSTFVWSVYSSGKQNIDYVHQLQNLFFCLCGTELSLSPDLTTTK